MDSFLQQLPLFKGIPEDLLLAVFPRKVAKGEIVFSEGEAPLAAYLLKSGLIKTVKHAAQDESSIIDFVTPRQMFGMIAVLDSQNYPVTTVAQRDCLVYRLPSQLFIDLLGRFPVFRQETFRQVGTHLRNSWKFRTLMHESAPQRVSHVLKYLLDTMGPEIQLLREDIATMAGCTESTAVRILIELRKKKIIQTGWKKIKILRPEMIESSLP